MQLTTDSLLRFSDSRVSITVDSNTIKLFLHYIKNILLSKLKNFVNELFLIYVNEVQHFEKHVRHPTKIDFKHDQDPNLVPPIVS